MVVVIRAILAVGRALVSCGAWVQHSPRTSAGLPFQDDSDILGGSWDLVSN